MPEQFLRIGGSDGVEAKGIRTDSEGIILIKPPKPIIERGTISVPANSSVEVSVNSLFNIDYLDDFQHIVISVFNHGGYSKNQKKVNLYWHQLENTFNISRKDEDVFLNSGVDSHNQRSMGATKFDVISRFLTIEFTNTHPTGDMSVEYYIKLIS